MINVISIILSVVVPIIVGILVNRELIRRNELLKKQIDLEEKKMNAYQDWLNSQYKTTQEITKMLANNISDNLKEDSGWAFEALNRAKIRQYPTSLFSDRMEHFRNEKLYLAERFTPFVLKRCKFYAEKGKRVFLLIDSGSTLYPFLQKLSPEFVRLHSSKEENWVNNIVVVTNNLPGIQSLMDKGRVNSGRYSELAVKCILPPGEPLPAFAAITGKDTESFIKNLGNDIYNKIIILLTTGNWIRIRNISNECPVLLARGTGHLPLKQEMINKANEIFLIAPLGKLIVSKEKDWINEVMNYMINASRPEQERYEEALMNSDTKVKLISTKREKGKLLYLHSDRVIQGLRNTKELIESEIDALAQTPIESIPHILFQFNELPESEHLQKEIEFPDSKVRFNAEMLKHFLD